MLGNKFYTNRVELACGGLSFLRNEKLFLTRNCEKLDLDTPGNVDFLKSFLSLRGEGQREERVF